MTGENLVPESALQDETAPVATAATTARSGRSDAGPQQYGSGQESGHPSAERTSPITPVDFEPAGRPPSATARCNDWQSIV